MEYIGSSRDPLFEREFRQVNAVLWRGNEINELTHFSLERRLEEQFEQVDIVRLAAEMLLQQVVDCSFEHECIVNGDISNVGLTIPARLTTTSDTLVHHVVCDEKVCL